MFVLFCACLLGKCTCDNHTSPCKRLWIVLHCVAGADFNPALISIRFDADEGQASKNLVLGFIPVVDDVIDENDNPGEYFVIIISPLQPNGLDLTGTLASLARIVDNDSKT